MKTEGWLAMVVGLAAGLLLPACSAGPEDGCGGRQAWCETETALACVDGAPVEMPCREGTYCNLGACTPTSIFFPRDAGPHTERTEWWYYTGHLETGDGARYGFEATIFRYDLGDLPGFMCHVAVTDMAAATHYHFDGFDLTPDAWEQAPGRLTVGACDFLLGGDGRDRILAHIPEGREKDGHPGGWTLDLAVEPRKRPARHGGDGIIPMSAAGGTSWYYSYTRLEARGTLATPDGELAVTGQAWMDHQWGDFDINDFKGWDWWSMQLDDGWEIMLFQFRDWDDVLVTQAGTLIDPDGGLTELLGFNDFSIVSRRNWPSPHTDGVYPLDWEIAIGPLDWQLLVTTPVDDQEMHNPAQNYWEGVTAISGSRGGLPVAGVGFTELTGYASDVTDPRR